MSNEDRLAELLEQWEIAGQRGQPVTPAELCKNAPDLLADFERLLSTLSTVNALLIGDGAGTHEELDTPSLIGRYRPLSIHASGGLGQVYLAEDTELHRTVALKRMHTLYAFSAEARQRFLFEAEITSKLDHPGIVPVFGSGNDEGDRPYYAMRFIHGPTLSDAAKQLHAGTAFDIELRSLVRSFVSVCQTVAYAHSRGVIHRDLKPGNIMLCDYGETLVVDWGLAKRLGTQTETPPGGAALELVHEGSIGKTLLGHVKGSPAYMSPEQARGDWNEVGPASDVYSLGATLYVLLTGSPPFEGDDHRKVIEQVLAGNLQPPRTRTPRTPAPLEAICLKAMQSRPQDRYPAVLDLVRDLEQWLADEPVSAWREPWVTRARRWLKRYRTFVTAAAAAVLVATLILTWSSIQIGLKNWELNKKNAELARVNRDLESSITQEKAARNRAERFLALLLDSQKSELLRDVMHQRGKPRASSPERLHELDAVVRRYREAQLTDPDNKALAAQTGYALYHRARADPGTIADVAVRQLFEQAKKQLQAVLAADPADALSALWLALAYVETGDRWNQLGKLAEARNDYLTARSMLETYVGSNRAEQGRAALLLANLCLDLCLISERSGSPPPDQLAQWCREAGRGLEAADQKGAIGNNHAEAVLMLAKLRFNLILLNAKLGREADAAASFATLLADMNGDLKQPQPSTEYALVKARVQFMLGTIYYNRKAYRPATAVLGKAIVELAPFDKAGAPEIRQEMDRLETIFISAVIHLGEVIDRTNANDRMELGSAARQALEVVRRNLIGAGNAIQRLALQAQREKLEALLKSIAP